MYMFAMYFDEKRVIIADYNKAHLLPKQVLFVPSEAAEKAIEHMLLKILSDGEMAMEVDRDY